MLEKFLVVLIVGIALYFSVRRIVKIIRGTSGCRCAAGKTPPATQHKNQLPTLAILVTLMLTGTLTAADNLEEEQLRLQSEDEAWWKQESLFGDLVGLRTVLEERGVVFALVSTDEYFWKTSGGLSEEDTGDYRGLLDFAVNFDLTTIGLARTSMFINAQSGNGRGLTNDTVGDLQVFSNIDADDYTQLNEYWIEHALPGDRVRFKIGRQDANADFAAVDHGASFLNSSFGVIANVPIPTFPAPGFGVTTIVQARSNVEVAVGVFEGAPEMGSSSRLPSAGERGIFTDIEASFDYKINGMPGTLRVAGWHHSGGIEAFEAKAAGTLASSNHGFYCSADQLIRSEGHGHDQGLGAFIQFGWAPPDRNEIETYAGAGLVYTGMLPGRDTDVIGIGAAHARLSGLLPEAGAETALEIFYAAEALPWLTVQPDLQYIVNPGGRGENTIVVGLRLESRF